MFAEDKDGSISLCDDGTLDTIIEYTCTHCGDSEEYRFSEVTRDDDGAIDDDAFAQLLDECAEAHVQTCTSEEGYDGD